MLSVKPGVRAKTVLIVEDNEAQRLALKYTLERRGFNAYGAGNVATARAISRDLGEDLDVMVLDMRLDDPEEPQLTGADLGIEVLSAQPRWPPEFLILTQHTAPSYYNLALRLGAAAYLNKSANELAEIISHIRALAIRRGLNPNRPSVSRAVQRIAETNTSIMGAVIALCDEVLGPEFQSCLGVPSVLFISNSEDTWCCGGNALIPQGKRNIYAVLNALAEIDISDSQPFVIDASKLRAHHNDLDDDILVKLDGAALLPLSMGQDVRICLSILRNEKSPIAEDPIELARTVAAYLRPRVLKHLFEVLSQWSAEVVRRRALWKATSWAYISVGQTQKTILPELADTDSRVANLPLQRLHALSVELVETGEMLELISGSEVKKIPSEMKNEFTHSTQMATIVHMVMEDLTDELPLGAISLEGDCALSAVPEDMYVATLRVLQFFAKRARYKSQQPLPWIRVECMSDVNRSMIVFQDYSQRLSALVRHHLFSPFKGHLSSEDAETLNLDFPLFIAKALVEDRNGGTFEDHSDEIDGDLGHRFVIAFTSA